MSVALGRPRTAETAPLQATADVNPHEPLWVALQELNSNYQDGDVTN